MTENKEIYRIYRKLKAHLVDKPTKLTYPWSRAEDYYNPLNDAVDQLIDILGDDSFDQYKYLPKPTTVFEVPVLRQRIRSLMTRLKDDHLPDEPDPLAQPEGSPTTIFSQSQEQSQNVILSIALDLQDIFNEKLGDDQISNEERSFLEKAKEKLKNVTSVMQLFKILIVTANEVGLSIEQLKDLLGL